MFIAALNSKDTVTANGSLSHSTSGSKLLDYFYKAGVYRNRSQLDVNNDMVAIFAEDKNLAMRMIFYNRIISRKIKGYTEDKSEVVLDAFGQGQKDEFIKSIKWLEENKPQLLIDNLFMIPVAGTWKDLWYDSPITGVYHYTMPTEVYKIIATLLTNMQDPIAQTELSLIAKFLPKILSSSNVKSDRHRRRNEWAKNLCRFLGWSEKDYRKFKSNPLNTAHQWQRLATARKWNQIDFKTVPGKALLKNIDSFTRNCKHFENWLKAQPVAKFTGYPYELGKKYMGNSTDKMTKLLINKQFDGLLEKAREKMTPLTSKGVWCALDTSGSMSWSNMNGVTPLQVCVSLGIYFSSLISGEFKDNVIMFADKSTKLQLSGSFTDKWDQISRHCAMGSTNFDSVIDEIVRVRKMNPNIPISDYPQTLLVVSDMQFNPATYHSPKMSTMTAYERNMQKLVDVGLPKINVIWWNVSDYGKDVPNKLSDTGVTLISGFDGAIISLILGNEETVVNDKGEVVQKQLTPYEQMIKALNQPVLNLINV